MLQNATLLSSNIQIIGNTAKVSISGQQIKMKSLIAYSSNFVTSIRNIIIE